MPARQSLWTGLALLCFIGLFLYSRILYLDADISATKATQYYAVDEVFYADQAFKLLHHGQLNYSPHDYLLNYPGLETPLLTFSTYGSLLIWGNNYYGLRMPSVITSLLIALGLLWYGWQSSPPSQRVRVGLCLMLLLLLDASFNLAGRITEPSIYRTLAMLATWLFAWTLMQRHPRLLRRHAIMIGSVAGAALLLSYKTNFFLLPAVCLALALYGLRDGYRQAMTQTAYGLLGITLALVFGNLMLYLGTGHWVMDENARQLAGAFSNRVAWPWKTNFFFIIHQNLIHTFATNIFRFNTGLLFLTLVAVPLQLLQSARKRQAADLLLASFLLFLFWQTLHLNDFYQRKLIVLFPLLVLVLLRVYTLRAYWQPQSTRCRFYASAYLLFWATISLGTLLVLFHTALKVLQQPGFWAVCATLILLLLWIWQCQKKTPVLILSAFLLLPECLFSARFIYKPSYANRDSMLWVARHTHPNEIIPGDYAHGLRLYGRFTPVLNSYIYGVLYGKDRYKPHFKRLLADRPVVQHALFLTDTANQLYTTLGPFKLMKVLPFSGSVYGFYQRFDYKDLAQQPR